MTKKLTAKSIRQGQTVYYVLKMDSETYKCHGSFLYSSLRALIAKNRIMNNRDAIYSSYSRRKAIRKAKELNRMMGA